MHCCASCPVPSWLQIERRAGEDALRRSAACHPSVAPPSRTLSDRGCAEGATSCHSFTWQEPDEVALRRTPIYDIHKSLDAKLIPFAGWEMPVWYTSVLEEHLPVRQAAGLFDVAHMGVYQAEGPDAGVFPG